MKYSNRYPRSVFSVREDVTRENMREYDRKKELFYKKCEEISPDYWSLSLRDRMVIHKKVEEELGFRL